MVELRRSLGAAVRTVAATAAQEARPATADASAVDLALAAVLPRALDGQVHDAAALVGFLREALRADACTVSVLRGRLDDDLAAGLANLPPLPLPTAIRLARTADALRGSRVPFDRPGRRTDVGRHAAVSSSFAHKGRLLSLLVRHARARLAVDLGTAYGMSALFLAAALPPDGRVVTVERAQPQAGVAAQVVAGEPRVTALVTSTQDAVPQIPSGVDVLFHDAGHSGADYVADFAAYLPLLSPGALVLFDDIRWPGDASTYDGWCTVAASAQVAAAAELDGMYGLLVLDA